MSFWRRQFRLVKVAPMRLSLISQGLMKFRDLDRM